MQIVRIMVWVVITAVAVLLITLNWGEPQPVRIFPGSGGDSKLFEWPIGFIGLFFFLLGFVPMWGFHRFERWRLNRRIRNLEESTARMLAASGGASTAAPATPDPAPATAPAGDLPPEPTSPVEQDFKPLP